MKKRDPFRYFKRSPEIIRLAVMLYIRFPLSLRNIEDMLHDRGIEISHESLRPKDNSPENLAILRRARPGISIRRKKRSGWSNDFARSVIGQMR